MGNAQVFLRKTQTGQWYAGPDRWVGECSGAHDFGAVEEAIAFWKGLGMDGAEVVLHYDEPECDLVLPLRERGS